MPRIRVLLVEDEFELAETLQQQLESLGYEVISIAHNADDAIRMANRHHPDIALMDVHLAGATDGVEVARILRNEPGIPVVLLTADEDRELLQRAKMANPAGFLIKPAADAVLHAALQLALHHFAEGHRRSEEQFRLLVGSIRDYAIFSIDKQGVISSWNTGAEALTGFSQEEAIGRHLSFLFPEKARIEGRLERFLATAAREGRLEEEGAKVRKDGSTFISDLLLTPVRDYAGTPIIYSVVIRDITEKKRTEANLRQAIQARDEFLTVASHELRTPLTSVKFQLQLLQREARRHPEESVHSRRILHRIHSAIRQVNRLGSLISEILDVSRDNAHVFRYHFERSELTGVLREILDRYRIDALANGVDLQIDMPSFLEGRWDILRIGQAIENLISNAIKYGKGHPVEVRVTDLGDDVLIAVVDYGIGVSEADQNRIFGRFERAVSSRSYGGLGLGLYMTRQIVEAHGGRVTVRSRPGVQTEFQIQLPKTPALRKVRDSASNAA